MRHRGKSGQARRTVWLSLKPLIAGFWLVSLAFASAQTPVTFGTKSARLWVNEAQVLAFAATSGTEKQIWETRVEPADSVEILQPATLLENQKTGFLRLRALKPGKAVLRVGKQSLPLQLAIDSTQRASLESPEIITPRAGAMLYGSVTVGVQFQLADAKQETPEVSLRAGERILKPRAQTLPLDGMDRIYAFDLNADQFPPGPLKLQTTLHYADGHESLGDPLYAYVMRPEASALVAGPCAETIQSPRPERFGVRLPMVEKASPGLPGGYVINNSADPAWCVSEKIEEPGWYQFFVRARGTPAAGSYPSIGLILDDRDRPEAATRLADREWQRVAVGAPVFLAAGEHILTARFLNDFQAAKGADRNLHLERYELVRVSPAGSAVASADPMNSGSMMMDSPAMTPMAGAPAMSTAAPMARPGEAPLAVTFAQPFHGRVITGPVLVRAQARWSPDLSAPRVDLLLNGKVQASQYGTDLDFRIAANAFRSGENRLQLRAEMPNGIAETSPVQSLIRPSVAGAPGDQVARSFRYSVFDPDWDVSMSQRLEKVRENPKLAVAAFYSNGESLLRLPDKLTGEFKVRLEARGQDFKGPPVAELFLKVNDQLTPIGEQKVTNGNQEYAVGRITLPAGPKQLVVRYSNDAMEDAKKDRNWWLKSLSLEETTPDNTTPPVISVRYAPPTTVTSSNGGADAVVAECFSPAGIQSAELKVDGKSQNVQLTSRDGFGRFVLPVLTRDLAPGIHHLQVLAQGRDKRETLSPRITFQVVAATPEAMVKARYARAIHLLNRFGYGPDPEELADILLMGELPWLQQRLAGSWTDPGERVAMAQADFRFPSANTNDRGAVINRTLLHLLLSPNAVRSRFVMWTENHFSTWIQKTEAGNKWQEHERFLELGVAPFGDLLFASATSPAMLIYLDQFRSLKGKLNENYAREIMELHTVGVHGGYSQDDVTNLAGLLTGWTLSIDAGLTGSPGELVRAFRYEPAANSEAAQKIFGMEFPKVEPTARLDRARGAIEMLAAHPATATFISRKLAEHYVSAPAPEALVQRLANRFQRSGGDMREMLMEIARSPEFWSTGGQPKLATPLDYGLRLCRQSGTLNPGPLGNFLSRSGMGLFDCATPNGYPEVDSAYADSNALLQRWNFSKTLQEKLPTLLPASFNSNTATWTPELGQTTLDLVATRLLGRTLSERSNQAALTYLQEADVPAKDRFRLAATFITQLPENNLR